MIDAVFSAITRAVFNTFMCFTFVAGLVAAGFPARREGLLLNRSAAFWVYDMP